MFLLSRVLPNSFFLPCTDFYAMRFHLSANTRISPCPHVTQLFVIIKVAKTMLEQKYISASKPAASKDDERRLPAVRMLLRLCEDLHLAQLLLQDH